MTRATNDDTNDKHDNGRATPATKTTTTTTTTVTRTTKPQTNGSDTIDDNYSPIFLPRCRRGARFNITVPYERLYVSIYDDMLCHMIRYDHE